MPNLFFLDDGHVDDYAPYAQRITCAPSKGGRQLRRRNESRCATVRRPDDGGRGGAGTINGNDG